MLLVDFRKSCYKECYCYITDMNIAHKQNEMYSIMGDVLVVFLPLSIMY